MLRASGTALLIGIPTTVAALYYLGVAIAIPLRYDLAKASAIQATQVYAEATYNGLIALALLLIVGLCVKVYLHQADRA